MPATSAVRLPGFQFSRFPVAPAQRRPPCRTSGDAPRRADPRRAPSRPGVVAGGALVGGAWLPHWPGPRGAPRATLGPLGGGGGERGPGGGALIKSTLNNHWSSQGARIPRCPALFIDRFVAQPRRR